MKLSRSVSQTCLTKGVWVAEVGSGSSIQPCCVSLVDAGLYAEASEPVLRSTHLTILVAHP